ncbi:MAG: cupin domain-containing protein [Alphaproteobacteria bacterium]
MNQLSLADMIEFNEKRRVKRRVLASDRMISDLLCYEPGQGTPEHHHIGEDEVFYVVEGRGSITVDGDRIPVEDKSIVFSPEGSKHSISADEGSRLVIMYVRSAGHPPTKKD